MKKKLLSLSIIISAIFLIHQGAQAQYGNEFNDRPISAQVIMGSQGIGLEGRYGISESFSARLGGSFLPARANNVFTLNGLNSTTNVSAKFYNVHLLADYIPNPDVQWLRIVGGAAYLYKAQGNVDVLPVGNYHVANYSISSAELGTLKIDVSWKGVAPYLGLGFFNCFPSNVFNMNFDLGTYYLNQPKSTIVGTKLLSDNYKLEPQVDSNLKSYRWLPVLQVNFNFRIQ